MVTRKPVLRCIIFSLVALWLTAAGLPTPSTYAQPPIQCPPEDIGPGISEPPGCNRSPLVAPDNFCLALRAAPNTGVQPGNLVTYTTTLEVVGDEGDEQVTLRFPIAVERQEIVDATFSRPEAWVSAILTDTVEVQLGGVKPGDLITTTLRTRVRSAAPIGADLSLRAVLSWRNADADAVRTSNLVDLRVATHDSTTTPGLDIAADEATSTFTAFAASFAPRETIALWYDDDAGNTTAIGEAQADEAGVLRFDIDAADWPSGQYQLVAYGLCSKQTATARITRP